MRVSRVMEAIRCALVLVALFYNLTAYGDVRVSQATQTEIGSKVFRSESADGVVGFNDYGVGEPVVVRFPTEVRESEAAIVRERQREILQVANTLSMERVARESARRDALEQRNASLQRQREESAALRLAESAYYPIRQPLLFPYHSMRKPRRDGVLQPVPDPSQPSMDPPKSLLINDLLR